MTSPATDPSPDVVLEARGITKRFPGVLANDAVDFELRRGEVHCLLGENGAGKSTLMNVIFGLYQPDDGELAVDGEPVRFRSSADAIARGIGMVHQHFQLVQAFSVAENVMLGDELRRGPLLDLDTARRAHRRPSAPTTGSPSTPTPRSRTCRSASSSASSCSRRCSATRRSSSSTSRPPCSRPARSTSSSASSAA